jgi:hypothetical protein
MSIQVIYDMELTPQSRVWAELGPDEKWHSDMYLCYGFNGLSIYVNHGSSGTQGSYLVPKNWCWA